MASRPINVERPYSNDSGTRPGAPIQTPRMNGARKYAKRDADTAIGTSRNISDAELASWSKGKRL